MDLNSDERQALKNYLKGKKGISVSLVMNVEIFKTIPKKTSFLLIADDDYSIPEIEIFEAENYEPENVLVITNFVSNLHCRPLWNKVKNKWLMMGGNFVYSCDSRFRQCINEYPIRLHDRFEG